MLTLCRLAAPVSIRPPQSPHLKPFKFFTSRARQSDGSVRLYLHMGYFESPTDALKWLELVRGRYPEAIATVAPRSLLQANPKVPALQPADLSPLEAQSLTDTRVLKILEARGLASGQNAGAVPNTDRIPLLRPDDTNTRRALKEAVVQGAPVFFAVQLHWSPEPIDLSRVPSLPIFDAHTLYATVSRREGRSRYFLRLGFFHDPISAKEVASEVRSHFASAAVVPVTEQELAHACEARMVTSAIPCLAEQGVGVPAQNSNGTPAPVTQSKPVGDRSRSSKEPNTLDETLEALAATEGWTSEEAESESGVRHLRVEVQQRQSRRS